MALILRVLLGLHLLAPFCYCLLAAPRPSQDPLQADPEMLAPESETGFYPKLIARQTSSSPLSDSTVPVVNFFTVSNATVCDTCLISWTYEGPANLNGTLLVTNSDTGGIDSSVSSFFTQKLSVDVNFSVTQLFIWSPVNVPAGTYTIFAVFPQAQYISQSFSVFGQPETWSSCLNTASSGGGDPSFNTKLIAPLVSVIGVLVLSLSFAIFIWLRRRRIAQTKSAPLSVPYFIRGVPRRSFSTLCGQLGRTSKVIPNSSRRKLIPSIATSTSTGATDGMSVTESDLPGDRWGTEGKPSLIQSKEKGLARLSMDIPSVPVKRSAPQPSFLRIDPYLASVVTRAESDTAFSSRQASSVPSARATDGSSFCTATTLVSPGDEGLGITMAQLAPF